MIQTSMIMNFIKGQVNELRLNSDGVDENVYLNDVMSFDEMKNTIVKFKSGKTCGLDGIPNEILKTRKVVICLWYLFKGTGQGQKYKKIGDFILASKYDHMM